MAKQFPIPTEGYDMTDPASFNIWLLNNARAARWYVFQRIDFSRWCTLGEILMKGLAGNKDYREGLCEGLLSSLDDLQTDWDLFYLFEVLHLDVPEYRTIFAEELGQTLKCDLY